MTGRRGRHGRHGQHGRLGVVRALVLSVLLGGLAHGGDAPPARPTVQTPAADLVKLTPEQLAALGKLFERFGTALRAGNTAAALQEVDATAELARERIVNELNQNVVAEFSAIAFLPDEQLGPGRFSVDVRLKMETRPKSASTAETAARTVKLSSSYPFVIQEDAAGAMRIYGSPFFATIGVRRGTGMIALGILLVIAVCAVLAFQVWMGFEVWRQRPRLVNWRWALLLLPILGATAYFFVRYIPEHLRLGKSA